MLAGYSAMIANICENKERQRLARMTSRRATPGWACEQCVKCVKDLEERKEFITTWALTLKKVHAIIVEDLDFVEGKWDERFDNAAKPNMKEDKKLEDMISKEEEEI